MGGSGRAGGKARKCTIPSFGQRFYLQDFWIECSSLWGYAAGVCGALVWLLSARLACWAGGADKVGGWVRAILAGRQGNAPSHLLGKVYFYLQAFWIILSRMWGYTAGVNGALVWLLSARLAGWAGGAGEVGGWVRVDGQVVQQFNAVVQNRQ